MKVQPLLRLGQTVVSREVLGLILQQRCVASLKVPHLWRRTGVPETLAREFWKECCSWQDQLGGGRSQSLKETPQYFRDFTGGHRAPKAVLFLQRGPLFVNGIPASL